MFRNIFCLSHFFAHALRPSHRTGTSDVAGRLFHAPPGHIFERIFPMAQNNQDNQGQQQQQSDKDRELGQDRQDRADQGDVNQQN